MAAVGIGVVVACLAVTLPSEHRASLPDPERDCRANRESVRFGRIAGEIQVGVETVTTVDQFDIVFLEDLIAAILLNCR